MTESAKPSHTPALNATGVARLDQARRLFERAKRLVSFCELAAPEILIESERQLLFKGLMTFPINHDAAQQKLEMENELFRQEQEHLHATGYYKDLEGT